MVELENCSEPEVSGSIILPTLDDDSPPMETSPPDDTTFFTVSFTCGFQTFTSPQLATSAEALAWAQDELSEFGDWSLSGNELVLSNSTCKSFGLSSQSLAEEIIWGCIYSTAINHNPLANANNFTCIFDPAPTPPNYIDVICDTFTVVHDISYSASDPTLVMDSYVEDCNVNTSRPAVLMLHGGGGNKLNIAMIEYCQDFARRGWKAYSIEFGATGSSDPGGFSAADQKNAVRNASACIRWLRANAVAQGINPLNIYMGGTSAGGLTSAQTNVGSLILDTSNPLSPFYNIASPYYNTYFDGAINAENPTFSSIPTATFTQSGSVNSAIDNFIFPVTKKNHFYHGTIDCKVAYSQMQCGFKGALEIYNDMIALGIGSTFVPFVGEGHGIGNHKVQMMEGGLTVQVVGVANPIYGNNIFTTDIGIVRKFVVDLSP